MRADRLLSILMLLQTRGRMTAHDLAERLEVSERTIYRDLEALGIAGVPLYTERGPGGGCSLVDGYQTRLTGLTETEIRILFLSTIAGPSRDLGLDKVLDAALLKVSAALPESSRYNAEHARQRFHIDATWWYHTEHTTPCLQKVQEAVWHDRELHLTYYEDDGIQKSYLVEPYGLVAKASVWYLIGVNAEARHVFRVSRILSAEITEKSFVRPEDFDLSVLWAECRAGLEAEHAPYSIPLRLAPDEARMLPQLLNEWGYALVESEELQSSEKILASAQHPLPQQRERKLLYSSESTRSSTRASRLPKEKKLFILTHSGEWAVLDRSSEEKKAFQSPPQHENVPRLTQKRISGPQQKEKKRPLKKSFFQRDIKKIVFPTVLSLSHLSHCA